MSVSVTIYVGPRFWFDREAGHPHATEFTELIDARDADRRVLKVRDERGLVEDDAEPVERPEHVVVSSADFATLSEAWINNFASLVRDLDPKSLHVQNPPAHVFEQLVRVFGAQTKRYEYPRLTVEHLSTVRRGFAKRVVGQESVLARLLAALFPLTRANANKPVVLMLYGPSGVGKTETARLLNDLLHGKLLRIQFSMYHSEKFASYIFGGAPSERSLAHDLLDRESGVILIDEFDKAHATFHSAFYEMFDEGVFVDKNYRVELGPSVIICTSNYASEREVKSELGDALSSRFSAIIEYSQLSSEAVEIIANSLIAARYEVLQESDRKHVDLEVVRRSIRAGHFTNVRTIGTTIDEIMSHMVVHAVLDAHETKAPPSGAQSGEPSNPASPTPT